MKSETIVSSLLSIPPHPMMNSLGIFLLHLPNNLLLLFSLSAGVDTTGLGSEQNHEQHDEENNNADTANEKKPVNNINVEGNCELLSEAYMEVPIVTETDSIASGSQNSLGMQYEESSLDMAQPSPSEKVDVAAGKQQGRKLGKYNRRGKGRGK